MYLAPYVYVFKADLTFAWIRRSKHCLFCFQGKKILSSCHRNHTHLFYHFRRTIELMWCIELQNNYSLTWSQTTKWVCTESDGCNIRYFQYTQNIIIYFGMKLWNYNDIYENFINLSIIIIYINTSHSEHNQ